MEALDVVEHMSLRFVSRPVHIACGALYLERGERSIAPDVFRAAH